jgi:hypothetical protein
MFFPTRAINGHDRNPVRRNEMNTMTESEKHTSAPDVPQPKTKRPPAKKGKPAKKAGPVKKQATKPKGDRANKKAEVIAMLKRAKGATLAEIMAVTKWQAHTVRGFVSVLGSRGGAQVESYLSQLAIQFRFGHLDKLGHEGLELCERGVWSGFRAGLHPRPLYSSNVLIASPAKVYYQDACHQDSGAGYAYAILIRGELECDSFA